MRLAIRSIPVLLGLWIATVAGCGSPPPKSAPVDRLPAAAGLFQEVSAPSGVRFTHHSGFVKALHPNLLQTTGSGCALFDYDGDGRLDLYLVDGLHTPDGGNRLYRNRGDGTFEDATERAGVRGHGYGMGCAVGDYDDDGHPDLYVTNYGTNLLYHNNGDGTFTERAAQVGVKADGWSTVAAFFDAEGDGDLDLYVGRYVHFNEKSKQLCETMGVMGGCDPAEYQSEADLFYLNQGNGTFKDATRPAGFTDKNGRALGVMVDDYDNDGRADVFVANDGSANFLFRNLGQGRFEDVAVPVGVAYSSGGRALASMGCDWGDYDDDGYRDLVIGSFEGEPEGLFRGGADKLFIYATAQAGLTAATTRVLTFGVGFVDFDRDGDLDLAQANGHVHPLIETVDPEAPYRQARQLFENRGNGTFIDISEKAGSGFTSPTVGRGMAFGDWDNDGDVDLLVNNNGEAAHLLRNESPNSNHWLGLSLQHPDGEAATLGARVTVQGVDRKWIRWVRTSYSFASANDPRVFFGLGPQATPLTVTIRWPGGRESRYERVAPDRYYAVTPTGIAPAEQISIGTAPGR